MKIINFKPEHHPHSVIPVAEPDDCDSKQLVHPMLVRANELHLAEFLNVAGMAGSAHTNVIMICAKF
jgi:hypothetical protein